MTRSHVLYWVWLSLCFSPGSKAPDVLLEAFDENAQRIFEAPDEAFDGLSLSEEVKKKLKNKDPAEAKKIYFWCKEHGVRLLAYDDPDFPARLRTIGHKPVLLYCKGRQIDLNDNLLIAMVGTRRMSSYGQRSAYAISHDLCCAGAVVVSGLALGVDAVCHRGALDASGDTVAVLGCGVDITYPKQNLDLMLEIEKNGLVLSEFKPGTRPGKSTFPIRNRIISGISQGTFVVEGDKTSGAMITARCALAQGRDLFSLPGMAGEQNSEGTNALLREGAVAVTDAHQLLSGYKILYPDKIFPERIPVFRPQIKLTPVKTKEKGSAGTEEAKEKRKTGKTADPEEPQRAEPEPKRINREMPGGLDEKCKKIYLALESFDEPPCADALAEKTGLPIAELLTGLTVLEIMGLTSSLPGGRFVLN